MEGKKKKVASQTGPTAKLYFTFAQYKDKCTLKVSW